MVLNPGLGYHSTGRPCLHEACVCGDKRQTVGMPIDKLGEPTRPYVTKYNSTPVRERYGELRSIGPAARVLRGAVWVPAVPVADSAGNKFYCLKSHLDGGKSRGIMLRTSDKEWRRHKDFPLVLPPRLGPAKPRLVCEKYRSIRELFSSQAMFAAWLKRHREIVRRCCNPDSGNYRNYGARGVTLYPEWKDPVKFFEYVSKLPGWDNPVLQIDRENTRGGYEPGNIRFVTRLENMHNRTITVRVLAGGTSVCLAALSRDRWPWYPVQYTLLHYSRGKTLDEIAVIANKYKTRKRHSWC